MIDVNNVEAKSGDDIPLNSPSLPSALTVLVNQSIVPLKSPVCNRTWK